MSTPSVQIVNDQATPLFTQLFAASGPRNRRKLLAAAAAKVRTRLIKHFGERQREGNRHGWPSRYFWRGSRGQSVAEKTQVGAITDVSATVVIASAPFAFKVRGGVIVPRRGRYLAIPRTAEAYAAGSPREGGIPGLFFVRRRGSESAFLATRQGGRLIGHYRLVRRVRQQKDTRALPAPGVLEAVLEQTAQSHMDRALTRRGGIAR